MSSISVFVIVKQKRGQNDFVFMGRRTGQQGTTFYDNLIYCFNFGKH